MQKIKIITWYIIVTKNNIIILKLWQQTSNISNISIKSLQIGDCIFYNKNSITKDEYKRRLTHWPDFENHYKKVTFQWFKKNILKQK